MTDPAAAIRGAFGHPNPFVRGGVAALVVFGGLYVADSLGMPGGFAVALLIGLGALIYLRR